MEMLRFARWKKRVYSGYHVKNYHPLTIVVLNLVDPLVDFLSQGCESMAAKVSKTSLTQ